jgi:hypothetical protein
MVQIKQRVMDKPRRNIFASVCPVPIPADYIVFTHAPDARGVRVALQPHTQPLQPENTPVTTCFVSPAWLVLPDAAQCVARGSLACDTGQTIYASTNSRVKTHHILLIVHNGELYRASTHVLLRDKLLQRWRDAAHVMLQLPRGPDLWLQLEARCGPQLPHLASMIINATLLHDQPHRPTGDARLCLLLNLDYSRSMLLQRI